MSILIFISGFVSGWCVLRIWARYRLESMLLEIEPLRTDPNIIKIVLERNNNTIYAYREDTSLFLGEGKNEKELKAFLENNFPDKKFTAKADNLKKVFFNDRY